jgi:hypothetical protein
MSGTIAGLVTVLLRFLTEGGGNARTVFGPLRLYSDFALNPTRAACGFALSELSVLLTAIVDVCPCGKVRMTDMKTAFKLATRLDERFALESQAAVRTALMHLRRIKLSAVKLKQALHGLSTEASQRILGVLQRMTLVPWPAGESARGAVADTPASAPERGGGADTAAGQAVQLPALSPANDPLSPSWDPASFASLSSKTGGMKRLATTPAATPTTPTTTPTKRPRQSEAASSAKAERPTSDLDIPGLGRMVLSMGAGRSELIYFTPTGNRMYLGCLHNHQTTEHAATMVQFIRFLKDLPAEDRSHKNARAAFRLILAELKQGRSR